MLRNVAILFNIIILLIMSSCDGGGHGATNPILCDCCNRDGCYNNIQIAMNHAEDVIKLRANGDTLLRTEVVNVALSKMINMKLLEAEGCELDSMPSSIYSLRKLEQIVMGGNHISDVSPEIMKMISLKDLFLDYNEFTRFPNAESIYNLKRLDLSNNRFDSLPDNIGRLTSLEALFLRSNELTNVPDSIGGMISLRVLDLRSNKLIALPESINKLSQLEWLYLTNNTISAEEKIRIQSLLPNCKIEF
jgi:Leucine-rich repeat (LRR) protein